MRSYQSVDISMAHACSWLRLFGSSSRGTCLTLKFKKPSQKSTIRCICICISSASSSLHLHTVPFYRTFRKIVPPWSGAWSCSPSTQQAPSSKPKPRPKRPCGSRPPLQSHGEGRKRRASSATALRISSAILIALTNSIGEASRTDNADPNG